MGGLARPARALRLARLTPPRWIAGPGALAAHAPDMQALEVGVAWLVRLDAPDALAALARVRPTPADLADAARWRDPARGAARLARRRLLRALAADALGCATDAVEVVREPGGRPRLAAPRPLCAAVARSGGWAALALAARPIGADVEAQLAPGDHLPLDQIAATDAAWVRTAPPGPERRQRFLQAWTAREAYLKALGAGLGGAPREAVRLVAGGLHAVGEAGAAPVSYREGLKAPGTAGVLAAVVALG